MRVEWTKFEVIKGKKGEGHGSEMNYGEGVMNIIDIHRGYIKGKDGCPFRFVIEKIVSSIHDLGRLRDDGCWGFDAR